MRPWYLVIILTLQIVCHTSSYLSLSYFLQPWKHSFGFFKFSFLRSITTVLFPSSSLIRMYAQRNLTYFRPSLSTWEPLRSNITHVVDCSFIEHRKSVCGILMAESCWKRSSSGVSKCCNQTSLMLHSWEELCFIVSLLLRLCYAAAFDRCGSNVWLWFS